MLREQGQWHSGEDIGAALSISRSAVAKHIASLRRQGYEIAASSRRGYMLRSAPNAPYPAEVVPLLNSQVVGNTLLYLPQTDSTNAVAAQEAHKGACEGTVVVADAQSDGRGRLHRHWHSPPGSNLYFSIILRPSVSPRRISQLPLVAAVSLLKAMARRHPGIGASVKWPNDILVGDRKLCGILCETEAETDMVHHVIVGIGINVNTLSFPAPLAAIATSIAMETGGEVSRPALLAEVLNAFDADYDCWRNSADLAPFLPFLESHSRMKGQEVVVKNVRGEIRGRVSGISSDGELLLDVAGKTVAVASGDVTLCTDP